MIENPNVLALTDDEVELVFALVSGYPAENLHTDEIRQRRDSMVVQLMAVMSGVDRRRRFSHEVRYTRGMHQ